VDCRRCSTARRVGSAANFGRTPVNENFLARQASMVNRRLDHAPIRGIAVRRDGTSGGCLTEQ
jgi:hypothetical protein